MQSPSSLISLLSSHGAREYLLPRGVGLEGTAELRGGPQTTPPS
jgi:hypothetical protein